MKKLLNFLFPNFTCLACQDEINVSAHKHICDDCLTRLPRNPNPKTDNVHAPFTYASPMPSLIMSLKYGGEGLVADLFAPFIAEIISETYDLIVPVPLSKSRMRERGYNQAELLARELSSLLSVHDDATALFRTRKTKPQVDMTTAERIENQKGAFKTTADLTDKRILLVDDVLTSGATANECARVLREAGATHVEVAVIARVV